MVYPETVRDSCENERPAEKKNDNNPRNSFWMYDLEYNNMCDNLNAAKLHKPVRDDGQSHIVRWLLRNAKMKSIQFYLCVFQHTSPAASHSFAFVRTTGTVVWAREWNGTGAHDDKNSR